MVKTKKQYFNNLGEFMNYINTREENYVFRNKNLLSINGSEHFTGTESYEEACNLLKYGWDYMAKRLEKELRNLRKVMITKKIFRMQHDMVGGYVNVSRYLQGIPNNMINQKMIVKKQPVVTLYKNIGYLANVKTEEIIEESIKALQIIQMIEASGMRVNLNLLFHAVSSNCQEKIMVIIKLKSANERLNISKLAFPLVHPSMLRRIIFKWMETTDVVTDYTFRVGYGKTVVTWETQKELKKDEILLPSFIPDVDSFVKGLINK
jgi:hypothetical protein